MRHDDFLSGKQIGNYECSDRLKGFPRCNEMNCVHDVVRDGRKNPPVVSIYGLSIIFHIGEIPIDDQLDENKCDFGSCLTHSMIQQTPIPTLFDQTSAV